jgi:hypothetical protein
VAAWRIGGETASVQRRPQRRALAAAETCAAGAAACSRFAAAPRLAATWADAADDLSQDRREEACRCRQRHCARGAGGRFYRAPAPRRRRRPECRPAGIPCGAGGGRGHWRERPAGGNHDPEIDSELE